jgi:RND family efflux transporter MFP subunit
MLGVLAACGGHSEDAAATTDEARGRQTVTAATVRLVNLPRVLTASGSVSPWEEVPVGAETGGLVATAVYVDEGAYVRQGQPLVQLNDSVLRAQVRQQEAQVATARANLARDEAALARAQELKERGYLSQASLDTATANQRAAAAALQSAEAALSEQRTRLSQTVIRAPVSGRIISRSVTRGQIVQAGTELFRMVRDGRLELDAQVPEADLPLVRAGQTATIVSEEAGSVVGTVRIVTPEVDPQTRLGVARVALPENAALRPGMFARAEINVGAQPAFVVPSSSIVYREGKAGVYVIGANDAVAFRAVSTGTRQGDDLAVTGLRAGERVVVSGAGFLGDGDRVTVGTARPAAASAAAAPAKKAAN